MKSENKISFHLKLGFSLIIVWFIVKVEMRQGWLWYRSIQAGEKSPDAALMVILKNWRHGFCLQPWMRILLSPYYLY